MKILGKWEDDLVWCPSQCYSLVEHEGEKYQLYLRWRHYDPWGGYIIHPDKPGFWSEDLFLLYHEQYKDTELSFAKKRIVELAKRYFRENKSREKRRKNENTKRMA